MGKQSSVQRERQTDVLTSLYPVPAGGSSQAHLHQLFRPDGPLPSAYGAADTGIDYGMMSLRSEGAFLGDGCSYVPLAQFLALGNSLSSTSITNTTAAANAPYYSSSSLSFSSSSFSGAASSFSSGFSSLSSGSSISSSSIPPASMASHGASTVFHGEPPSDQGPAPVLSPVTATSAGSLPPAPSLGLEG